MKNFFLVFVLLICGASVASAVSLDEYLGQVKGQHAGYKAANKQSDGYKELQKKAKLVTAPNFFATAESGYNNQTTALINARYNKVTTQNYTTGISHNSAYGINTKFTYAVNKYVYNSLVTTNDLAANNYQSRPIIEINVPLLQGRFGSLTKATVDSYDSQSEAQKYYAQNVALTTIIAAEQSYWNLVAARKILQIQNLAANQAKKILDYVAKRERMNLGETADVLQARALVETKSLDLRQAQNDVRYATLNFNRYRYVESYDFDDLLDEIDFVKIDNAVISQVKPNSRPDVKAAKSNMKAAVASAVVEEENAKPNLNLYGAYAFKGAQPGFNSVVNNSFNDTGREALVGVRFSVPFYIGTMMDIQQGAKQVASAARQTYQQKTFDEEKDWQDLIGQLIYYQQRAKLAREIEMAQKKKLENERVRLRQGRTSTYQVLLFEQDYCQSQINTILSANQFLALMAQKKLYD